ncbi:MAG: hypothetical protein LBS01_11925 [Prevotellaceae bacterium]|jgi:hypothetical protein|nr:hypothetical protein [Prevotellaceae bacterium]
MSKTNFRVQIPTNAEQMLNLAERVYSKHMALGEESPLNSMVSNTWEQNGVKIAECLAFHRQAEDAGC